MELLRTKRLIVFILAVLVFTVLVGVFVYYSQNKDKVNETSDLSTDQGSLDLEKKALDDVGLILKNRQEELIELKTKVTTFEELKTYQDHEQFMNLGIALMKQDAESKGFESGLEYAKYLMPVATVDAWQVGYECYHNVAETADEKLRCKQELQAALEAKGELEKGTPIPEGRLEDTGV